jgi:hypothetical protein
MLKSENKAGVCHFVYHTATFQGNTAEKNIIEVTSADGLKDYVDSTCHCDYSCGGKMI